MNDLRYSDIMVSNGALNIQTSNAVDEETITQLSWKKNITKPHPHDILSGRGNGVNMHPGNQYFRSLVQHLKNEYVVSDRSDKPLFAKLVYGHVQALNPPGRFLKHEKKGMTDWVDMGEKLALEKTRQALREDAAKVLNEIESGRRKVETNFRISLTAALNRAPQTLLQQNDHPQALRSSSDFSASTITNTSNSSSTLGNPIPIDDSTSITSIPNALLDSLIKIEVQKNSINDSLRLPLSFISNSTASSSLCTQLNPSMPPLQTYPMETLTEVPGQESVQELNDSIIQEVLDKISFDEEGGVESEEFPGDTSDTPPVAKSIYMPSKAVKSTDTSSSPFPSRREVHREGPIRTRSMKYVEEFLGEEIEPAPSDGNNLSNSLVFRDLYTGQPVETRQSFLGISENSLYHPDLHKYHTIGRRASAIMASNFVKELEALEELNECIDEVDDGEDSNRIEFRPKRKFRDSAKALSHFRNSLEKCISEFAQPLKKADIRNSTRTSLLLRQSIFSSCEKLQVHEHSSGNGIPVVQLPDLFNDKMDRRRSVLTESTKQLLEMVFGKEQRLIPLGAEREILANILDPKSTDQLMKQLCTIMDETINEQDNVQEDHLKASNLNADIDIANLQL